MTGRIETKQATAQRRLQTRKGQEQYWENGAMRRNCVLAYEITGEIVMKVGWERGGFRSEFRTEIAFYKALSGTSYHLAGNLTSIILT